jgi:HPt (histidine-containing phosphotransfer) domain-containing protein
MASAIDREEILARLSGDRELIAEVVDLFVADRATLLGDIRRAVAQKDPKAAREAAHRLKGVLATLAARAATATAQRLEELARNGDLSAVPSALDALEREVDAAQAELARLVDELAPDPAA